MPTPIQPLRRVVFLGGLSSVFPQLPGHRSVAVSMVKFESVTQSVLRLGRLSRLETSAAKPTAKGKATGPKQVRRPVAGPSSRSHGVVVAGSSSRRLGVFESVPRLGGVAGSVVGDGVVGSAGESDRAHRCRHPASQRNCARCLYLHFRPQWEKYYGAHRQEIHGRATATVWLAQRPARLGGDWALGCIFCARWVQSQVDFTTSRRCGVKRKRGCRDGNTKWARFEIKVVSQVAMRGICQHANTSMHRRAVRYFFAPDLLRMRACRLGIRGTARARAAVAVGGGRADLGAGRRGRGHSSIPGSDWAPDTG